MRSFLLITFYLLISLFSQAQVSTTYSFTSSSGTYTPITGGVNYNNFTNWSNSTYTGTLPNTTAGFLDDNLSSALLSIGFNFVYNGVTYTQFGICTNGWISLGALPVNSTVPLSSGTSNNVISALGNDLIGRGSFTANRTNGSAVITITGGDINLIAVGDKVSGTGIPAGATVLSKTSTTVTISANATSTGNGFHFRFSKSNFGIRYQTIGSAPNRTLVVQWTGWQRYTTSGAFGELYNFQIRLNETTNTIDFVYDFSGPTSTTTTTFQIGLRGASSSDFINRTSTTSWSSTNAGSFNTSTVTLRNTIKPASGLTYTWTPIPVPSNNDCSNPDPLTVNNSETCIFEIGGTSIGATQSLAACTGTGADDDVWYSFVATYTSHIITVTPGTMSDVVFQVYSGTCAGLTSLSCVDNTSGNLPETTTLTGLTIGDTYLLRVHSYANTAVSRGTFTICVSTPCTTPTNGGTLSTDKSLTTVNDAVTLTTTGNEGSIIRIEWSFDNFTNVDGFQNDPTNPYSIALNLQVPNVYFRTVSKNGTCPEGYSNVVDITLKSAPAYSIGVSEGDFITNVTFGDINNTTTSDGDAYSDFASISGTFLKEDQYNLSITATNTFGSGQGYAAWIDWNGDGIFSAAENVLLSAPAASASQLITIPSDAVTGNVLMRVLSVWGETPSIDPYYSTGYTWGEIEEYTIGIQPANFLPVELLDFYGYHINNERNNKLIWKTASEINNSHFSLFSSLDGMSWMLLDVIQGNGNSNELLEYQYTDEKISESKYYLLSQTDYDGTTEYFEPIYIQYNQFDPNLIVNVFYTNLHGQIVDISTSVKGIYLKVIEYSNGKIKVERILN